MAFTKTVSQVCILLAVACSTVYSQTDPGLFNLLSNSPQTGMTGTPGGTANFGTSGSLGGSMDLSALLNGGGSMPNTGFPSPTSGSANFGGGMDLSAMLNAGGPMPVPGLPQQSGGPTDLNSLLNNPSPSFSPTGSLPPNPSYPTLGGSAGSGFNPMPLSNINSMPAPLPTPSPFQRLLPFILMKQDFNPLMAMMMGGMMPGGSGGMPFNPLLLGLMGNM